MTSYSIGDDLNIAQSLIQTKPRLAFLLLDNILEVFLVSEIQGNAMFDYLIRNTTPESRLKLYKNHESKLKYAVEKRIITDRAKIMFDLLHKIRNAFYHKNHPINFAKELATYYHRLLQFLWPQHLIGIFDIAISNELCEAIRKDLLTRSEKFKQDVSEACTASRNYSEISLTIQQINDCLDHVFSNYGEGIIEKSTLPVDVKSEYISKFIKNKESINHIFKMEIFYEMEKRINEFAFTENYASLKFWFDIDQHFSTYEEVVADYVHIAC